VTLNQEPEIFIKNLWLMKHATDIPIWNDHRPSSSAAYFNATFNQKSISSPKLKYCKHQYIIHNVIMQKVTCYFNTSRKQKI